MQKTRVPQESMHIHEKISLFFLREKIFSNLALIILFLLVFSLPLFFSRIPDLFGISHHIFSTNLIFSVPKTALFFLLSGIFALFCVIHIFITRSFHVPQIPKYIFFILAALLISALVSTVFSHTPWISFFGQYERQQGFLSFISGLLFFLGTIVILEKKHIPIILKTVTVSATLVSLYAFLQKMNLDPIMLWDQASLQGRVFSTFGHPNFLGYFFIFSLPTAAYLLYKKEWNKWFVIFSLLLQTFALVISESRGAILGLLFGSFCALFLCAFSFQNSFRKILLKILGILVLCFFIFFLVFFLFPQSRTLVRLDTEQLRSVSSRFVIWQDMIPLIWESPVFGHGFDTLSLNFAAYKSPALLDLEQYNNTADRAHNIILDTLYTSGFLGILSLGILSVVIFSFLFRSLKESDYRASSFLLLTVFLSWFFASLFGFSTLVHDMYLWLFFAIFIIIRFEKKEIRLTHFYVPFLLLIFLYAIFSIGISVRLYKADHFFLLSLEQNSFVYAQKSIELYPWNANYILDYLFRYETKTSSSSSLATYLEKIVHDTSYPFELYKAVKSEQSNDISAARERYIALQKKYPAIATIYFAFGAFEYRQKNYADCIEVYEKFLSIGPSYWLEKGHYFHETPEFRTLFRNLSFCSASLSDFNRLEKYAQYLPDSSQKYQWLYEASLHLKHEEQAEKYFQECTKQDVPDICKKISLSSSGS